MLSYLRNRVLRHVPLDVGSAIGGIASLAGASIQSDAASNASDAQAAMYSRTRADLLPSISSGNAARNELMKLLGLSYAPTPIDKNKYKDDPEGYQNALAGYNRKLDQYNTAIADPEFGSLMQKFTGERLAGEPGYQFGMNQGMQALDRGAAARGNYLSGAALKAGQRYAQDYAGTKFNEAFSRDDTTKNRAFNWLMGISSAGQNAAAQTGNAAMQNGAAQGNYAIQQGNAMSSGLMGVSNAFQNYQANRWQDNMLATINNNRVYQNAGDTSYSGWNPAQLRAGTSGGWS